MDEKIFNETMLPLLNETYRETAKSLYELIYKQYKDLASTGQSSEANMLQIIAQTCARAIIASQYQLLAMRFLNGDDEPPKSKEEMRKILKDLNKIGGVEGT